MRGERPEYARSVIGYGTVGPEPDRPTLPTIAAAGLEDGPARSTGSSWGSSSSPAVRVPGPEPADQPPLETRELSPASWPDFERLFRKYHGVQAGCWCMFYHREGPTGPLRSRRRQDANRADHHALLLRGRAHGILVFRGGDPVGWCQFGRREELPRLERGRKYRSLAGELAPPPNWRITCFFVDRAARRSGVARAALHAALKAIRRRGGGLVEAYPATHGKAVAVWFGTVGMFEREGFSVVRPFGRSNVLVRRQVEPGGAPARLRRRAAG